MDLPFSTTVRWDRFYYISLGYFLFGIILMPFSRAASVIFFLMLLSIWSSIPGYININLIEANIYELVFVAIALNYGGFLAGLLVIPYCFLSSLNSVQYEPKDAIRWVVAAFITLPLMPFMHSYFGNNFLLTVFSYTTISYSIFLVITAIFMIGQLFETLRYMLIALPIAFGTNILYVRIFGDPLLGIFNQNLELKLTFPLIIGAFLLAITGIKIFAWWAKKYGGREIKTKTKTSEKQETPL